MKLVTEQLLKDMVLGIDLALEKIPDECDCQAYTESDTNATIHQEEVCQVFSRYHLEAVKSGIEKILSAAEQSVHPTPPTARSFSATCPKCGTFIGVDFANTADG